MRCDINRWCLAAMLAVLPVMGVVVRANARHTDDGRDWWSYGRDYTERFYSPLRAIDAADVHRLGLAWSYELPGIHYAASVPLAVNGVLYFCVDYSVISAVDAQTGKLLWHFDPHGPEHNPRKLRFAWGSRGLAYWDGKIYTGTVDGRLIALDARTGHEMWSVQTVDPKSSANITGAPRVFNGKVVIGFGGADIEPLRGRVTAYDAATGKELWRFYTVPPDPGAPSEGAAMDMAAKTWSEARPRGGGGGTAWNALTYDAELNRLYIGVGNGYPHDARKRSPGAGDNLFLSSIVAVDADTGRYLWHYQTNPHSSWDYSSAMDIAIAEAVVDGKPRKVLVHAPKNGFLYVLDRQTGRLISAEKFSRVTWADHIDLRTGRPVENPAVLAGEAELWPHPEGAHSTPSMAVNPATGLVYIPVWSRGYTGYMAKPQPDPGAADVNASWLSAWDASHQREVWRARTKGFFNGGAMTTAGGLVFQGQGDGELDAYDAATGQKLWSFPAGMGIHGTPITYEAGGRQYVSVLAGLSGATSGPLAAQFGWQARVHPQRLLTFALDEHGVLPRTPPPLRAVPLGLAGFAIDARLASRGEALFNGNCAGCHGEKAIAGGSVPDLRASPVPTDAGAFRAVVQGGALLSRGMPPFGEFGDDDLAALQHYLRQRAAQDLKADGVPNLESFRLRRCQPDVSRKDSRLVSRIYSSPDHAHPAGRPSDFARYSDKPRRDRKQIIYYIENILATERLMGLFARQ